MDVEGQNGRIDGFVAEWREKIARGAKRDDAIVSAKQLGVDFRAENEILKRVFKNRY